MSTRRHATSHLREFLRGFSGICVTDGYQVYHTIGKEREGFQYSIHQERYLKVFLDDGEVPMDNNAAEQSIRGFCIGKKNWVMIDTVAGAKASAIIYSIAETAKANGLKPYDYFEHLLTEIPKHLDDTDRGFLEDLLPWSPNLPANCRKSYNGLIN